MTIYAFQINEYIPELVVPAILPYFQGIHSFFSNFLDPSHLLSWIKLKQNFLSKLHPIFGLTRILPFLRFFKLISSFRRI